MQNLEEWILKILTGLPTQVLANLIRVELIF